MTVERCNMVWDATCVLLRERVDGDTFERYFADIVPVAVDDDNQQIILGVSNDLVAFWLGDNYQDLIEEALAETGAGSLKIRLETGHDARPVAPAKVEPQPPASANQTDEDEQDDQSPAPRENRRDRRDQRSKRDQYRYRPDFTFDNFVVGNSNKICVASARAVSEKPGRAYNPLLIYGGVALGKTHLLQSIANYATSRRKRAKVEYLTSEEFVNLYVEALQTKKLASFRRHFRSLDILLIDDIQFFEGKVGSSEEFFHTFNTLHNAHKQIVLASDRMPQEISGLEQRLVSRFEWGLSAEVLPPDWETRVAILKKKQETQNIKLPDEVLHLVASRITSNIRNLEGAMTRLIMNVSAFDDEMTPERATELLQDRFDQERSKLVTIEAIQRRVADHFDITRQDMTSKKRPRSIALPRMVAMYISRRLTNQSLPAIGDAFNRNHATVIHAVDKIGSLIEEDDSLRASVETLERLLKN